MLKNLKAIAVFLVIALAYYKAEGATLEHCWESKETPKVRHFFNHPCKYKNMQGGSVTVINDDGYVIKGCSIYSTTQRVFIVEFPQYNVTTFMSIDDFDYSMECIWKEEL